MPQLIEITKQPDLIYDIGMHKAEDTRFYLQKGFRVIAIEADPKLVEYCRKQLSEYINTKQLVIVEGAIVDVSELRPGQNKISFYENEENTVWGTVCTDWAERNVRLGASSKVIEVDALDLAEVLTKYGMPRYMKIDIEGCDMVCINVLERFNKRPDYLSLESDKTSFGCIGDEINVLYKLGYNNFQAVEQSGIPRSQQPPYPAREGDYVSHIFESGSSGLFGAELDEKKWRSRSQILHQYRLILAGYYLLGDDGIMHKWSFTGAGMLRAIVRRTFSLMTGAAVPGWYDTHARHSCVDISPG